MFKKTLCVLHVEPGASVPGMKATLKSMKCKYVVEKYIRKMGSRISGKGLIKNHEATHDILPSICSSDLLSTSLK